MCSENGTGSSFQSMDSCSSWTAHFLIGAVPRIHEGEYTRELAADNNGREKPDALYAWWSRTILLPALHRTIQLMNVCDCGNSS